MMVEKVPDSTYEMIGGLEKQIEEVKEVVELPIKHPELFEALGIPQPKVFEIKPKQPKPSMKFVAFRVSFSMDRLVPERLC